MSRYKAILFDLDGTLLYTLEDLMIAVNETLKEYHYAPRTLEQIRQAVGNGNRNLMALSLDGGEGNPLFEEIFKKYVAYYLSHDTVTTKPYTGIDSVISYCKEQGIKIGVITNKLQSAAIHLTEHYFPGQFDVILGDDGKRARKPAKEAGYVALEALKSEISNTLYVGDSAVDAAFAENMGMDCILCEYGFCDRSVLTPLKSVAIVKSPKEILKYI